MPNSTIFSDWQSGALGGREALRGGSGKCQRFSVGMPAPLSRTCTQRPLALASRRSHELLEDFGRNIGALETALATFDAPALHRLNRTLDDP